MAEGIDVYSKYQHVTSWPAVKSNGIDWCYQKVSDGIGIRTINPGPFAGVLQGGYHFSQPGSPVAQANLLVDRCTALGLLDLNPALDLEDNPPGQGANIPDAQKADWAIAFGHQVIARGHGFTLYANDSTWRNLLTNKVTAAIQETFRWVARYGAAPSVPYHAWQYTSSGSCPGISTGSLDRNKGSIPLNNKGGVMAGFDASDFNALMWGNVFDTNGNRNYAAFIKDLDAKVTGLTSSVTKLTNLVVTNEANDVTNASLAAALEGAFTASAAPIIRQTITDALASVEVHADIDGDALSNTLIAKLLDRLAT